jgi:hypothetical protein
MGLINPRPRTRGGSCADAPQDDCDPGRQYRLQQRVHSHALWRLSQNPSAGVRYGP